MCADAASGREIEVCLQLATAHPDEVDGIAAALRGHLDRATSADRRLLLALLDLLDEETGPAGARRLAELGDPRAVPPLVHAAETRAYPTSEAAVAALAGWPGSIRPLSRWLVDAEAPMELRLAAADALGALGTREAGDALLDLLRRPGVPDPLRRRALAVLAERWPGTRVPYLPPSVDGTPWIAAASAWSLGYAMAAAGQLGRAELTPLGAVTGATAGGTAGYLFGRAWPMEAGGASRLASCTALGTTGAFLVGRGSSDDPDVPWLTGLGDTAAGYGTCWALRRRPGRVGDAFEATAMSLVTGVGAGAVALGGGGDPSLPAGIGVLAGAVLGHAVAPHVRIEPEGVAVIGGAAAVGAAVGGLAQGPSPEAPWIAASAAGGAWAGAALVATGLPPDTLLGSSVGGAYGGALGSGLALSLDADRGLVTGLGLGAGAAGVLVGGALAAADPEPVDDRDAVLVGLATGWAAWQVAGWSAVGGRALTGRRLGPVLALPALVGSVTTVVARDVDVGVPQALAATSLGLWGGWLGGTGAELAGVQPLPAALVVSNVGLLGGVLLQSPEVGVPALVVGLADAGGVLGGAVGAISGGLVGDDDDVRLGSLIGAGVGLAGGATIGAAWARSGTTRDVAWRPPQVRWTVAPVATEHGFGAGVQAVGW